MKTRGIKEFEDQEVDWSHGWPQKPACQGRTRERTLARARENEAPATKSNLQHTRNRRNRSRRVQKHQQSKWKRPNQILVKFGMAMRPEDFLGMLAPSRDVAKPKEEEEAFQIRGGCHISKAQSKASDDPAKNQTRRTNQSLLLDVYPSLEF